MYGILHACGAQRDLRKASDLLKLELQTAMSQPVDAGNQTPVLWKSRQCSSPLSYSLALGSTSFENICNSNTSMATKPPTQAADWRGRRERVPHGSVPECTAADDSHKKGTMQKPSLFFQGSDPVPSLSPLDVKAVRVSLNCCSFRTH